MERNFSDGDDAEVQFAESILIPVADTYYKAHNINFDSVQEEFSNCETDDFYLQFLIGIDSDTTDILRDLIGLDDVVPLLVAIDIPNRRIAIMEYGVEITLQTVTDFVDRFEKADLKFIDIRDEKLVTNEADC